MLKVGLEISIISALIITNAVFALSETAVVTARKSRLLDWASKGSTKAKAAVELANTPNRFLLRLQIGTTVVCVLAGAFGARTLADEVAKLLASIPVIEPYSQTIALGVVVIGITYFLLVLSELVPKRLAMRYPETIATVVAVPLRWFSKISFPVIHLLSISTDAVCRPFGKGQAQEPGVTEARS